MSNSKNYTNIGRATIMGSPRTVYLNKKNNKEYIKKRGDNGKFKFVLCPKNSQVGGGGGCVHRNTGMRSPSMTEENCKNRSDYVWM